MPLNQRAVSEIAATLYWNHAERHGVAATTTGVADSDGALLFKQHDAKRILDAFGYGALDAAAKQAYERAIRDEAVHFALEERNMIGQIYLEDMATGRSEAAAAIDTLSLRHIPQITVTGDMQRCGRLCLRHPLPAVVFSDELPIRPYLLVEDTKTALGYDLPMILTLDGQGQTHGHIHILTGAFHIPVPAVKDGKRWNHVIQNSTRFVDAQTLVSDDGIAKISCTWPRRSPFSWLRK